MGLYNVSIINKHDVWLKEDEENLFNWIVMSKEQLEDYLGRNIKKSEIYKGRVVMGYDDIVWKKFT